MFFFCVSASRTQDIHKLCCQSLCVNSFSSSPLFGKIQLWLGGLTVEVISPSVALACDWQPAFGFHTVGVSKMVYFRCAVHQAMLIRRADMPSPHIRCLKLWSQNDLRLKGHFSTANIQSILTHTWKRMSQVHLCTPGHECVCKEDADCTLGYRKYNEWGGEMTALNRILLDSDFFNKTLATVFFFFLSISHDCIINVHLSLSKYGHQFCSSTNSNTLIKANVVICIDSKNLRLCSPRHEHWKQNFWISP